MTPRSGSAGSCTEQPRYGFGCDFDSDFDFDFNRIAGLFEPAKQLGVELFLLDDGWFGNKYPRVNDKAGLGDWEPSSPPRRGNSP